MRAFLKPDEVFSNLVEGTEEALNDVFPKRRLNGWERNRITRLRGQAVKTSPFHGGNTGSIPVGVTFIMTSF